jgi:hypothetical protein
MPQSYGGLKISCDTAEPPKVPVIAHQLAGSSYSGMSSTLSIWPLSMSTCQEVKVNRSTLTWEQLLDDLMRIPKP